MKKPQFFLSLILIIAGFILISSVSLSKITGNVVSEKPIIGFSSFGFIFLILGIVLFLMDKEGKLEKTLAEKNLAQEIKESGKIINKPNEIIHIAKKSGYVVGNEVREGTLICDKYGNKITVIPRHNISSGVYRNIISELAKGESNFRKRNY